MVNWSFFTFNWTGSAIFFSTIIGHYRNRVLQHEFIMVLSVETPAANLMPFYILTCATIVFSVCLSVLFSFPYAFLSSSLASFLPVCLYYQGQNTVFFYTVQRKCSYITYLFLAIWYIFWTIMSRMCVNCRMDHLECTWYLDPWLSFAFDSVVVLLKSQYSNLMTDYSLHTIKSWFSSENRVVTPKLNINRPSVF